MDDSTSGNNSSRDTRNSDIGFRINFVSVDKSNCNELLKKAFEALQEAELSPSWTDAKYCLSLKKRHRSELFVVDEFAGDVFEHLRSLQCAIIGPGIVLSCLQENKPLPKSRHPIFSDCMNGMVACCSNVKQADREQIRDRVLAMNGRVEADLSSECTLLITPEVGSKKYKAAVKQQSIRIVTPCWVEETWRRCRSEMFKARDDDKAFFDKYKCPIFAGLTITVSSLRSDQKNAVERMTKENGGKFSGDMKQGETTHLVTDTTESQKYKTAKKWTKQPIIVSTDWFFQSVQVGYCLDELNYPTTSASARAEKHAGDRTGSIVDMSSSAACFASPDPKDDEETVRL